MGLLSRITYTLLFIVFFQNGFSQADSSKNSNRFPTKISDLFFNPFKKLELHKNSVPDTSKYIRFGIIPYQILCRSSGFYFAYHFNKLELEYRPTYTFPTKNLSAPYWLGVKNDRFFFQGINNNLAFKPKTHKNDLLRFLFVYRIWWYNKQIIPAEGISLTSSYSYRVLQSSFVHGPGAGLEFTFDLSDKFFDCNFYFNFSQSFLFGNKTIYSKTPGSSAVPSGRIVNMKHYVFNIALGFECGYRSKKKKPNS